MDLCELLSGETPILLDGAMATQLASFGLEMDGQNNVTHPETVLTIHKAYAESGCHILTTNTLTMNRLYIETHHLPVNVREVNLAGVKLAKAAVSSDQYVLGDISSTGRMLEPYGDLSESDATETFKEQASLLAEGGVDGFIIETMIDLREALCALQACKSIATLPVIVSMAFATTKRGGHTVMGNSSKECAGVLAAAGASAIGANCGDLHPSEMALIVSLLLEETSVPIVAQPNAGKPKLIGGHTVFDMSPPEFAAGILKCLEAGARLVGGCCGSSPEHILAVREMLS